jgi:predicted house-cleaning noncanonical NTP pyrophosphatase (MazG superfamily)
MNTLLEYGKLLNFSKVIFQSSRLSDCDYQEIEIFFSYRMMEIIKNVNEKINKILENHQISVSLKAADRKEIENFFLMKFEKSPDVLEVVKNILEQKNYDETGQVYDKDRMVQTLQELRFQNLELGEKKSKLFEEIKRFRTSFIQDFNNL